MTMPRSRAMLIVEVNRLRRVERKLRAEIYRHDHGVRPLVWEKVKAGIYRSEGGDINAMTTERWLLVMCGGGQTTHRTYAAARGYADLVWAGQNGS